MIVMTIVNMNAKSNISPEVLSEIQKRVDRVHGFLKQATSAWLSIAREFAFAREALSQLAYERFVNDVGITKAVADKLVRIGQSKVFFVEENLSALSSVEGWTVLYELAKLEQKQITSLLEVVANDRDKKLTRELVHNFANNKALDAKRLVVASIEVDEEKLKAMSFEQFNEVKKRIDALDAEIGRINAGFVLKSRSKTVTTIADRARANSNAMIVATAA
jgi:hypothetical protein